MQDQEAVFGDGFADDGEIEIPFLEDRPRLLLHVGLQHHEHPLLAFAQHHFVRRHALLAAGHLVHVQPDAGFASFDQFPIENVGQQLRRRFQALQGGAHGGLAGGAAGDDWMTLLLQSRAFHKVPPANLQAVFIRMQRINASAGDVVIRQGDEGDYFYAIVSGRCLVTRETPLNREGIKLAELGMGDTFGEESLISGARRNATVTMTTDGVLMRLGKDDFNTLLNEPMLHWVGYEEAKGMIAAGGRWLDVRLPSEFEHCHFEHAINVPLYFVRLKLKTLDPSVPYLVCCDNGRRSSAAAFSARISSPWAVARRPSIR